MRLRSRWITFWYNFRWNDYAKYLNGNTAKASALVPLFGYAVLFNDQITEYFSFERIAGPVRTTVFLDPDSRLQFVFFGLMLLAIANALYRFLRPYALRLGESESDYTDYFMKYATAGTFLRLHLEIRGYDFDPWTQDGKYYNDDWDLFWREAVWPLSGKGHLKAEDLQSHVTGYDRVNFSDAKLRHETLLLSILRETYFRETRKKRFHLVLCLMFATLGYTLLLLPSIDLTLRVVEVSIWRPILEIMFAGLDQLTAERLD